MKKTFMNKQQWSQTYLIKIGNSSLIIWTKSLWSVLPYTLQTCSPSSAELINIYEHVYSPQKADTE